MFSLLKCYSAVTDGQWHHIGLVYDHDTLHRYLYVNGTRAAQGTTAAAALLSDGDLYFGASHNLEEGSFSSGLIDDIRIYNVALSAKEIREMAR